MPGPAVLRQLRQRHLDRAGPGLLGRAGRRAQARAVPRPRPQLHQVREYDNIRLKMLQRNCHEVL